jgi:hypothetical protein
MKVIELDTLEHELQDQLLSAAQEAIVITQHDCPILVVRSLLDDDVADDLIAQHPAFLESIREARKQKAQGQVRRLADLRQKYSAE